MLLLLLLLSCCRIAETFQQIESDDANTKAAMQDDVMTHSYDLSSKPRYCAALRVEPILQSFEFTVL